MLSKCNVYLKGRMHFSQMTNIEFIRNWRARTGRVHLVLLLLITNRMLIITRNARKQRNRGIAKYSVNISMTPWKQMYWTTRNIGAHGSIHGSKMTVLLEAPWNWGRSTKHRNQMINLLVALYSKCPKFCNYS